MLKKYYLRPESLRLSGISKDIRSFIVLSFEKRYNTH